MCGGSKIIYGYYHNQGQPKTKLPGLVLLLVLLDHTTPHHPTPGIITIRAFLLNIGFSVSNITLTQLDEVWKTTSILFLNGSRHKFSSRGRLPQ